MRRLALLLISVSLVACASKPSSPTTSAPEVVPPESSIRIPSVRETFPKEKKEESAALLQILKGSKVSAVTMSNKRVVYRAFDVDCRTNVDGKYACSFARSADCASKACRAPVKDSEALANILFGMPVAQGDSGATTPYIECLTSADDTKWSSCSIAIMLDYQGP